ncbi:putative quinol monooxygenase [Shewanella sp. TC10]|uniref:putative quinol monooxygenase n=1 Tax=Shewanella sp. TC10 TaxID=1419739 RepID=UPI00129D6919|nr:antibiotic biosynthesis monooxygenase [Shewanella sp. TC10]
MPTVKLTGYIQFPENTTADQLADVSFELVKHSQLTLNEEGCISFSVTQSPINQLRFDVSEEFVDKSAFEFHQKRVKLSNWFLVSQNATRHYTIIDN